ncbi:protein of unknown function [Brevefilum fermentans]|uniref:Uncharacterized protein n=1 Tax=Candidatus Brevifilum fermentans TaxID=1986204 RepID=A0A1Y6K5N3_9CHLR|nr:protein of unknown function [Brevefilum fermentans]
MLRFSSIIENKQQSRIILTFLLEKVDELQVKEVLSYNRSIHEIWNPD